MVHYYHIRQREGEMKHSVVNVNIGTDSFWVCMSESVFVGAQRACCFCMLYDFLLEKQP